jgi:hypothetical protein
VADIPQPQPFIYAPPADPGRFHDFEGPHPLRTQPLDDLKQLNFLLALLLPEI